MVNHNIYIVTSPSNKQYVGQTVLTPQKRWQSHYWKAHSNCEGILYRAIRKYGKENFVIKLLISDISNQEEANLWEILMIRNFNTFENGYNMTEGGEGTVGWEMPESVKIKIGKTNLGRIVSEETRKKMSEARMGHVSPMLGKTHSESTKKKMSIKQGCRQRGPVSKKVRKKLSLANMGHVVTEETRQKISMAHKGKFISEETRQRMSKGHKGVPLSDEHKRAIKLCWEKRRRKNK